MPPSLIAVLLFSAMSPARAILSGKWVRGADFDSAIPRFESWLPSQPVGSLRCDFQLWDNRRHSRGLAGNGRVFGEENRALPTEGGAFLHESLLHEFSISGI